MNTCIVLCLAVWTFCLTGCSCSPKRKGYLFFPDSEELLLPSHSWAQNKKSQSDEAFFSKSSFQNENSLKSGTFFSKSKVKNEKRPIAEAVLFKSNVGEVQPMTADDATLHMEKPNKDFTKKGAPSCAGKNVYCKEDAEYDEIVKNHFKMALENSNLKDSGLKVISKMLIDPISPASTRTKGIFHEDPVCPSRDEIIFPKRGMTPSSEWVFILNQDNMTQGIKVEFCDNVKGRSNFQTNSKEIQCGVRPEEGSNAVCHQKFIYRNMLTMDSSGKSVIAEAILVPSCCVCFKRKEWPRYYPFSSSAADSGLKKGNVRRIGSYAPRSG